jgi:hypothetical protein
VTTLRSAHSPDRTLPVAATGRAPLRYRFIDSPAALARLRRSRWLLEPSTPRTRILLDERTLGAVVKRAEARVNALHASCGCFTGKLAVLATLLGLLAAWARGSAALDGHAFLVALGALAAAAIGGKVVGIAWSRVRLFLLLSSLERHLARMAATGAA